MTKVDSEYLEAIVTHLEDSLRTEHGFFKEPQPYQDYTFTLEKTMNNGPLFISLKVEAIGESDGISFDLHVSYAYGVDLARDKEHKSDAKLVVPTKEMVDAHFRPLPVTCTMTPVEDSTEFAQMHTNYRIEFSDLTNIRNPGYRVERFIAYLTKYVDVQLRMLSENRR